MTDLRDLRPIWRLHPTFGARPLEEGEGRYALTESGLPQWWTDADELTQATVEQRWFRDLFDALQLNDNSRVEVEVADRDDYKLLRARALAEAPGRKLLMVPSDAVLDDLLRTNPSRLALFSDDQLLLMSVDTWDGVFLVGDSTVLSRVPEPVSIVDLT